MKQIELTNEVKFNFLKKEREVELYNKIRKKLIKKGYKPLNNITYKYSFDCKQTKISNYPFSTANKLKKYPHTIIIKMYSGTEQNKLIA